MEILQRDFDSVIAAAVDEITEEYGMECFPDDLPEFLGIFLNCLAVQVGPSHPISDAIAALKARL